MTTVEELHRDFPTFHRNTLSVLQNRQAVLDVDELAQRINTHQRALNEATDTLPAYDVRRYQSSLDELTALLSARRAEMKPKSKFSFKTKRSEPPKLPSPSNVQQTTEIDKAPAIPETPGSLTIRDAEGQFRRLDVDTHSDLLHCKTITVESFTDSQVDLSRTEPYTSVTLRNLTRCTIKAGTSSSSLFIESCQSCQIDGEAQQFRIHSCSDCEIRYACKTGRPVIEDCKNMRFGNKAKDETGQRKTTVVDDFSDLSGEGRNWAVIEGFGSG